MTSAVVTSPQVARKFVFRFLLACAAFYGLTVSIPSKWMAAVNALTARSLGILLHLIPVDSTVDGVLIRADGFSVQIITECSAVFLVVLLTAFVLAYPTSNRNRLLGLAFGVPVILGFNLMRLFFVFIAGLKTPEFFEATHVYLGQVGMILVVLAVSMAWLRFVSAVRIDESPCAFVVRFLAWSAALFLCWLVLQEVYVLACSKLVIFLLGAFGQSLALTNDGRLHPVTLNMVTFSGLILATRSTDWPRKMRLLALGLVLLSGGHLLFWVSKLLAVQFGIHAASGPKVVSLILSQWVLPFLLWILVMGKGLFPAIGIYVCPFCGKQKMGITEHIRAKHGADRLKDERVQKVLTGRR